MTQLKLLGRSRSGAQVRLVCYAGGLRQPRHAHDCASVTLVIGGALEESVSRAIVSAGAGRVCVKPAGVEHSCRFHAPATRTLQIVFPGARADSMIENVTAWRWLERGAAAPLFEVLRACRDADAAPARLDDALADAAALFFGAGPAPRRVPPWLARVGDALIDSDASVADIAAREGLHRTYLARAFFRHVGLTPVAFRRTARALRAMDLLATRPRAQADIALASGFADQSHMIRELRAVTGYTPARWRAQAA